MELGIHSTPEELVGPQKKVDQALSVSKQLTKAWYALEVGIGDRPGSGHGASPVPIDGFNKPRAVVAAYRVAALSIQEAFVLLRRHCLNDHAAVIAGVGASHSHRTATSYSRRSPPPRCEDTATLVLSADNKNRRTHRDDCRACR